MREGGDQRGGMREGVDRREGMKGLVTDPGKERWGESLEPLKYKR